VAHLPWVPASRERAKDAIDGKERAVRAANIATRAGLAQSLTHERADTAKPGFAGRQQGAVHPGTAGHKKMRAEIRKIRAQLDDPSTPLGSIVAQLGPLKTRDAGS